MKKQINQLRSGVYLSYINLLLGSIIPFIYTPIMLRLLGQAEYSLYGIVHSIMGYIGLLNFGIGGAILRYLAKYRAEGNTKQEERVAGLFVKIYSVICCLILTVGLIFAANIQTTAVPRFPVKLKPFECWLFSRPLIRQYFCRLVCSVLSCWRMNVEQNANWKQFFRITSSVVFRC